MSRYSVTLLMKTLKNVKNSIKFKVQPKSGLLTVRAGSKKYTVPVEVRLSAGTDYLFLSIPGLSEIFKIESNKLVSLDPESDGEMAHEQLNAAPARARKGRRSSPELPGKLQQALAQIPAGYKLVFDLKTGQPRLAKTRAKKQP